ncbi:MAG TPA: CRTAC1 family protein, partial [Candidatus Angelobacter sp.]|nr:CRTAC1 family protein [Candidatus Angelobacter sp.]
LDPDGLEQKWLLNLACMAVGKYPHAVPSKHLIPLAPFGSEPKMGRFEDVAPMLGIDKFGMSGSVVMDDFDNDGFLDLIVSSWDPCAPLRYFHNGGDGTFSDRTEEAGLSSQLGGLNLMQTDYNNDGWLDLYILRGAWESPMRHSLLRNNGNGTFTDVTYEAGLAFPATSSGTAVWFDFDNDGLLDLFVGNEYSPSQLFHNNGDGTFTDIAHLAGVNRIAFTKGVTAGDFNNDGFPDLYVSNYGSENFLYQNRRDGTFADVAKQFGVEMPLFSFPTWFFDYNNDGWLDIFVSSFIHSVSEVLRSYLGMPVKGETLKLYRNMGGKGFQDATAEAGLARVFMPMGANFGDLDNDGFLDFYLGTGDPSYASMVPNVLFKNRGGKSFVDVTASSRTGSLQKGHGVAIGDIFNTGIPCIYENIGGATPGDRYYCALFRGAGNSNNWINVKLVGRKTNRAAVGARIKLVLTNERRDRRSVYRDVNSGGSFGASPLQQHIGIGQASIIETLEVWWPTSRTRQVFHDVAPNQFIEVHEFDKNYRRLNRRPIKWAIT